MSPHRRYCGCADCLIGLVMADMAALVASAKANVAAWDADIEADQDQGEASK